MHFSHLSIGGGIVGVETVISIVNELKQSLKRYKGFKNSKYQFFDLGIIDKNPNNISGGVAYSFHNSRYGYFNNPIRLSPYKFQIWIKKIKNKEKILKYLESYGGFSGKNWIETNKKILLSNNKKNFEELYLPRVAMNYWMEERLEKLFQEIKFIKKRYKVILNLSFFKGEVIKINQTSSIYKQLVFKNNCCFKLKLSSKRNNLNKYRFTVDKKLKSRFYSITQSISLGLNPPKQLATNKANKAKNYIWDFYADGSTSELLKKIFLIKKTKLKKKILIYFIGYKAGLLEPLTELRYLIFKKGLNIKAICSSSNLHSIEKAELTLNKPSYNPKFFKNRNINKINTAKKLYDTLKSEFNHAKSKHYQKYDVWTVVLKNKFITKCFNNFNVKEKNKYNNYVHNQIRNLTRFTYPETLISKDILIKQGLLHPVKEKVIKIDKFNNNLIVYTQQNKKNTKYICDIVVNVSGPLNVNQIKKENSIINNLKKFGGLTGKNGFIVNKDFEMFNKNFIFLPGTLAQGFNPGRKTIIEAILENAQKSGKRICKVLINKNINKLIN